MAREIPIAISACLLGDQVRYDGQHKRQEWIAQMENVEWLPVCPEVEAGMGVPREKIQVELVDGDLRLMGISSRHDWTVAMDQQACQRIEWLKSRKVCGYILKSRSPSCGIQSVPVWSDGLPEPVSLGNGRFVDRLVEQWRDLPLADETMLQHEQGRQQFLEQVRDYWTRQQA